MADKPIRRIGGYFEQDLNQTILREKPWLNFPAATNEYAHQRKHLEEEVRRLNDIMRKYQERLKGGLL